MKLITVQSRKSSPLAFTLLSALLVLPIQPVKADSDRSVLVAAAAATSAIFYGCYKWYKSSSYNKAEKRIDQAVSNHDKITRDYKHLKPFVDAIENFPSEHSLVQLINQLPAQTSIQYFATNLDRRIEELNEAKTYLRKKLLDWQSDGYYAPLRQKAEATKTDLKRTCKQLQKLHISLARHRDYFELSRTVQRLHAEYQEEVTAFNGKTHLDSARGQQVARAIQSKSFNPRQGYPLIAYAEQIDPDSRLLSQEITALSKNRMYQQLLDKAHILQTQIDQIKNLVAVDPEYQRQRSEYALYRQNEQMVKARQREVEELARKNKLESDRLQEERKKTRLLEKKIDAIHKQTREYERIERRLPLLENLIMEIQRTIRQEIRTIDSLKDQLCRATGMSPECFEYQECLREIRRHEDQLENLRHELNRLINRLKREP